MIWVRDEDGDYLTGDKENGCGVREIDGSWSPVIVVKKVFTKLPACDSMEKAMQLAESEFLKHKAERDSWATW